MSSQHQRIWAYGIQLLCMPDHARELVVQGNAGHSFKKCCWPEYEQGGAHRTGSASCCSCTSGPRSDGCCVGAPVCSAEESPPLGRARMSYAVDRLPFGRMKAWCAEDERLPGPGAGAESDAGQAWMRPPSRHCFRHVVPFTALYAATSTMDLQGQACVDASERAPYD